MPENLSLLKLPKRSLENREAASGDLLRHCLRRATWDVRGNPRHRVLPKTGAVSVVNERAPRSPPTSPHPKPGTAVVPAAHSHRWPGGPCPTQVSCASVGTLFGKITANTATLPWVFNANRAFPAGPAIIKEKYLLTTETLALHQWIKT